MAELYFAVHMEQMSSYNTKVSHKMTNENRKYLKRLPKYWSLFCTSWNILALCTSVCKAKPHSTSIPGWFCSIPLHAFERESARKETKTAMSRKVPVPPLYAKTWPILQSYISTKWKKKTYPITSLTIDFSSPYPPSKKIPKRTNQSNEPTNKQTTASPN